MRSVALHSVKVYDRSYVLAIFSVAYATLAAMQQQGVRADSVVALVAAPLVLAWVWQKTRLVERLSGNVHPTALAAVRYSAWGAALWVAARTGPAGRPGFDMGANIGLGLAVVAAQVALARIPGRNGLIRPPRSAHAFDAAGFCALLWGVAIALPAARTFSRGSLVMLDPLATDYATSAASIASVLLLLGAALRLRVTRRLELGVLDRAAGAVTLCATALSIALPAAIANLAPPDRALPLGALGAALACGWAASTREATSVATTLRGALVVMVFGAPLALGAAALAQHVPGYAGVSALAGALGTLVVGVLARSVAKPLTAEQSRWLEALEAAARAAREPDPDAAIVSTLVALQGLERTHGARPELWRADPAEVLRVDVAGYLHTERAAAPAQVYELTRDEPERTLRRDVLAALEVRRADVRPLLGWMDAHDTAFVTLIADEQVPLGLLCFPKGSRQSPLTLEEAIAARHVADRLSAVLSISSSIVRSRLRETSARERADELVLEAAKLEAIIELTSRPRDYLLESLAAGVQVAAYSARARGTLDALSRIGAACGDVALELPTGIDALGYAAFVHAAGPRRGGPFVVIEGTAAAQHDPSQLRVLGDTPLARARGGTLLVSNIAALPMAAQDALAVALSERPVEPADARSFALVATSTRPPAELLEERLLSRALARFVIPNHVVVPALVDRPEDLRGLVFDRLCKAGVRFDGQTLGIEPRALGLLVDHLWPGNVRELCDVVERAAKVAVGERVRVTDLERVGFVGASDSASAPSLSAAPSAPAPARSSPPVSGARRVARGSSASGLGGEAAASVAARRAEEAAAGERAGADDASPEEPRARRRRRR